MGAKPIEKVEAARTALLGAIEQLCRRATSCLRVGTSWQDVVFLAQAASAERCSLGVEATEERRQLAVATILDGLRRTRGG